MVIEPEGVVEQDQFELAETLSVLADAEALAEVREAYTAIEVGDLLRGVAAVRALRPQGSAPTGEAEQPDAT